MQLKDAPVIVEQEFNISKENIWKAITELAQMRRWFFGNIESFKPEVGFETNFNVESGGRSFLHLWKLTEVVPNDKITYNWRYGGYPGNSYVTFQLIDGENKTILKVTHEVVEDFPIDIPEFSKESCYEGWIFFIKQSLKQYLKEEN